MSKQTYRRVVEYTKSIKNSGVDFLQQQLLDGIT